MKCITLKTVYSRNTRLISM